MMTTRDATKSAAVEAMNELDETVFREEARRIVERALGVDAVRAVGGAIDASVFELIDLIAEWVMKIITKLMERFKTPEAVAAQLRRPRIAWKLRLSGMMDDQMHPKFKQHKRVLIREIFIAGERCSDDVVEAGMTEVREQDLFLV